MLVDEVKTLFHVSYTQIFKEIGLLTHCQTDPFLRSNHINSLTKLKNYTLSKIWSDKGEGEGWSGDPLFSRNHKVENRYHRSNLVRVLWSWTRLGEL